MGHGVTDFIVPTQLRRTKTLRSYDKVVTAIKEVDAAAAAAGAVGAAGGREAAAAVEAAGGGQNTTL